VKKNANILLSEGDAMTSVKPLGFVNARDLGGLAIPGIGRTRHGVLYRSEIPLEDDPEPDLHPWPPATVCDLRSTSEQSRRHPLAGSATTVLCLPMTARADPTRMATETQGGDLTELYQEILVTCTESLVRVAEAVSTSPGATLIHCAGGKDRTGVAIAVLLAAVGVCRTEIIKDYQVAQDLMPLIRDRLVAAEPPAKRVAARERLHATAPRLLGSPANAIEAVVDHLESHNGGAAGWLREFGLQQAHLSMLCTRLLAIPSAAA
jgi:protein-tyrosine phosphatase